jgi:hypothetical protein
VECYHLVNIYSPDALQWRTNGGTGNPGTVAWPAANQALFFPFELFKATQFVRLYNYNGGAVSGNVDIGIYTEDGTRIVSTGSVAVSGTNVNQAHTIDVTLAPGRYYLGMAHDGTSTSFYFTSAVGARQHIPRVLGVREMAAAFPLPATATLTAYTTTYTFPIFGASRITTI